MIYPFVDNTSTYLINETIQLSNIKVHFLPPNTTSHLQSLDAENSSDITPIDIFNAITFASEVKIAGKTRGFWQVSEMPNSETLPKLYESLIKNLNDDINKITLELQDIINELNLQNPITAKEFICINDEIPIESLSDKKIIDAALNSLEKVILYFKNPPDDITINYTELKSLNILKSKINNKNSR
ncbi:hypothetical protein GLOIN_2v1791629 [Rhizophagus irregularis DAOM 181602=DAOM 197198]|uniref:DDE-1 domain-containing protein n=1 Tax=Rhizophagus irregularis (strain DAOM 181602 / DAOM 197198 / MUCL 43194) TaxID=747089 RepID=A0A2P4NWU3_RHIID|nr:hypothetical protein GLOIN_2v1791629 [Rhizophagus irregularis DAOM 181602=DAOM 197198]POG57583.1 hypothetical protein GLOIN_2v1791629 [Rhizophagus irregularis DAOM 181602=DAOM 197198]|eukprot:XP_025164449.1 hypothetical protein GLOIN_2v1791629 [Rhizophagus irregularis DAOM 181602=DAOM 197198]